MGAERVRATTAVARGVVVYSRVAMSWRGMEANVCLRFC